MNAESTKPTYWPMALLQTVVCWATYLYGDGSQVGFMVTLGAVLMAFPIFSMVTIDSPVLKGYIRANDIALRLGLGLNAIAWLVLLLFLAFPLQFKLVFIIASLLSSVGTASTIWLERFRPKPVEA